MTLYQRQQCGQRFKDHTIKALNALMKGTGWKRNSAWVFKVEGDWYLTAFVTGGTTPDGLSNHLRVEMGIKPMAVDPINWRAKGLHYNLGRPPSFRSNAAFKVPALPIAERQWSEGLTDVTKSSRMVFDSILSMADDARRAVATKPFSQLVSDHEHADRYAALKWASLISEGHGTRAIEAIKLHYRHPDSVGDASSAVNDIVAAYQSVIDGTDAQGYRLAVTDIFGNPVSDGPILQPLKKVEAKGTSWADRLKAALLRGST
ncbi:hypothetical protein [Pseudorhodobacter ferrugineus]|nr:hypothetical protein [Pseudorhodobacter ferrugineus]